MNKPILETKSLGRKFWVEIPPVDWILRFNRGIEFRVGKLKPPQSGLVVVERYADSDGSDGWVIHPHKNFHAMQHQGNYDNEFLRAVAHKLGVEKILWKSKWKPIWVKTDDYFADWPQDEAGQKARQERTAALFEESGDKRAAAAYRREMGLAKPHLVA